MVSSTNHSYYLVELKKTSVEAANGYLDKIKSLSMDPYTLKDTEFDLGPSNSPITSMDICSYLVFKHSFYSKEQMKAYKSLTAYKYFQAGLVENIGVKQVNGYVLLMSNVRQSMKPGEPKLRVWVIAERDGEVCTAHCPCIVDLSEVCNHIVALLYTVEHATRLHEVRTSSCTDVWTSPADDAVLEPTRVSSMDWGEPTETESTKVKVPSITPVDVHDLLLQIKNIGEEAVLMSIVEPFASEISRARRDSSQP